MCHIEAVLALLDNLEETVAALGEILKTDLDVGGHGNAFRKSMEDSSFVFYLFLLRRVLMQCNTVSKTL